MYTYDEIMRQCECWLELPELVRKHRSGLNAFLERYMDADGIISFTGAGSSEYIGRTILPYVKKHCPYAVDCCGSTDLVVAPESYISSGRRMFSSLLLAPETRPNPSAPLRLRNPFPTIL